MNNTGKTALFLGAILLCIIILSCAATGQFAKADELDIIANPESEFFDLTHLHKEIDWGYLYLAGDCWVCVPKTIDENTAMCIYYAGGTGGNALNFGYSEIYLKQFKPNAIFIWYKHSNIYQISSKADCVEDRTLKMVNLIEDAFGYAPKKVEICGSSNGGYTTLQIGSWLCQHEIAVDKIMILDMGQNWYHKDKLINQEQADVMIKYDTIVYHFGRAGEAFKMPGAQQFASYGVKMVEVGCDHGDHDAITMGAYHHGLFSWLIGEIEYDDSIYHAKNVNF